MRRHLSWLVIAVASVVAVAGCGGGTVDSAQSGSGPSQPATISLTNSSTSVGPLVVFVAQARGLFAKQNLTVNISSAATANIAALLSSGQTDLIYGSTGAQIGMAQKGRDVVTVYGISAYNRHTELWSDKVKTLEEAKQLSSCRIASSPPGSAQYGYAKFWIEKYGLKCEIVTAASIDLIVSGVKGGSYDFGIVPRGTIGSVPEGVNVVIADGDAAGADAAAYDANFQPPGAAQGLIAGLQGLPENLAPKKDAVARLSKALIEAQGIVDKATTEELVADIRTVDIFKAIPPEQLVSQVNAIRPGLWKDPATGARGYVSDQAWAASLNSYTYWGLDGYDPASPTLSYSKMIDMSFYDAAKGS